MRRMLDRGERAAEARDFRVLRELIAEDYRDNAGRDRSRLLGQARAYLRHGGSVHVYSRVASLRVVEPARAEVELLVAVAAGPIAGLADLRETSADLARVHLVLGQPGGRWQVESAEWRAAELAEFF